MLKSVIALWLAGEVLAAIHHDSCIRLAHNQWRCGPNTSSPGLVKFVSVNSIAYGDTLEVQSTVWAESAYQLALKKWHMINYKLRDSTILKKSTKLDDTLTDQPNRDQTNLEVTSISPVRLILPAYTVNQTLAVIEKTLRLYGPEGSAVAFNGGKDATVVLNFFVAAVAHYYATNRITGKNRIQPNVVYFYEDKSFPEITEFVLQQTEVWDLRLRFYHGSYKERMQDCIADFEGPITDASSWNRHPAFLIGVRQDDHNDEVASFEPSDAWLKASPFMRVHPLVHWNYGMIWNAIEVLKIQYCPLYDEGFTSLGRLDRSMRNERLKIADGSYLPAKELDRRSWKSERRGRDKEL